MRPWYSLKEVAVKPTQAIQECRKIRLSNEADWTTFTFKMKSYQAKFLSNHTDKSADQLWSDFTENPRDDFMTSYGLPSDPRKYCIVENYVVFEANKIKFKPLETLTSWQINAPPQKS